MTRENQGDFTEFATAAWPRLVRIAHLLTGDFHEAEDLVQTPLAKVYARWPRLPREDVDMYVRRALVNNNISRVRRRRVAHLLTPLLPEPRAHPGHADAVAHRMTLVQALSALPERQRTALILRYYDDLGDQDVAAVLRCSLGTAKTHIRRGLAALRAHPGLAPDHVSTGAPR